MCGRYILTSPRKLLQLRFQIDKIPQPYHPRFNLAPSQALPVIVSDGARRTLEIFSWGLIPHWAAGATSTGTPSLHLINARAETAAEKLLFRDALRHHRCLVPADGFYEWKKEGKAKTPYLIRLKSREPFAMAGIFDAETRTFAILTTGPNALMKSIHDRMPVILGGSIRPGPLHSAPHLSPHLTGAESAWLSPSITDPRRWLTPFPAEEMEAFPVSTLVNSPKNDLPECIEPAPPDAGPAQESFNL